MPYKSRHVKNNKQQLYAATFVAEGKCPDCRQLRGKSTSNRNCQNCQNKRTAALRRFHIQAKKDVIAGYGGKCECCGETEFYFLTIDHKFNDGSIDPISKNPSKFYSNLRKLGYTKDRYRLLCWNCNIGRDRNGGICPHKSLGGKDTIIGYGRESNLSDGADPLLRTALVDAL